MPQSNVERSRLFRLRHPELCKKRWADWYALVKDDPEFKRNRNQKVYDCLKKKKLMKYLPFYNSETII